MGTVLDVRLVKKSLKKKGFVLGKRDDHWVFHYYKDDGKRITGIHPIISFSHDEISGRLLKDMRRQCKLRTAKEFIQLVQCPISKGDYRARLREQGCI